MNFVDFHSISIQNQWGWALNSSCFFQNCKCLGYPSTGRLITWRPTDCLPNGSFLGVEAYCRTYSWTKIPLPSNIAMESSPVLIFFSSHYWYKRLLAYVFYRWHYWNSCTRNTSVSRMFAIFWNLVYFLYNLQWEDSRPTVMSQEIEITSRSSYLLYTKFDDNTCKNIRK